METITEELEKILDNLEPKIIILGKYSGFHDHPTVELPGKPYKNDAEIKIKKKSETSPKTNRETNFNDSWTKNS